MGRKSKHGLPPGIHKDGSGQLWATLEGDDARRWRERYPGRALPRRKADDLRQARQLQRELSRDLEQGRDPGADNPTVAAWVRQWIDGKQRIKPFTIRGYRRILAQHIETHAIGRLRLAQVKTEHVQSWIGELQRKAPANAPDKRLDPYTIRNAYALLRAAMTTAVNRDMLAKTPCRAIELPQPDDEEIQPLMPEQANTLLSTVDQWHHDGPHRLAALYHVAVRCGLRQGELLGLLHGDIDLERRQLRVGGQLQRGERTSAKTRTSNRTVPISAALADTLRQHLERQKQERAASPQGWNAAGLVFCSEAGTPLAARNLVRHFKAVLKRVGLPGKTRFHDVRHTYAALQIAAKTDIYTLSRLMGHSSINVTAGRYAHLYDEGKRNAADALDQLLKDKES